MKKFLFFCMIACCTLSAQGQSGPGRFNAALGEISSYWNYGSDLPDYIKSQVDLFVGSGENILMPPGGKAALAFSTSRYMNESELRTYFESKILGMQGVSIYYAGIPTSLSVEIVLNFDIMTPIGYDYTYTFTTADGDSRTITVKGKEQISITTPSPLSLDDPYQIFTISLSKSYPNETYQLQRDGQTVASLPGDPYGAPISFRGAYGLGTYTVTNSSYATILGSVVVTSPPDENYILSKTYLDKTEDNFIEDVVFYNGLGDQAQAINIAATPDEDKNIVTPYYYDAFRRGNARAYLPYVSSQSFLAMDSAPFTEQSRYYSTIYADDAAYAFSKVVFDDSPLNRPVQEYKPGKVYHSGNGKFAQTEYLTNSETGDLACLKFSVTGVGSSSSLDKSGYYPAGALHVTRTTNEDGSVVLNFADMSEKALLVRQISDDGSFYDTYSVYDLLGNLCYVLPPELSAEIATGALTALSDENLASLAYIYKYDGRNRIVEKRLPGAQPEEYAYDNADRMTSRSRGSGSEKEVWEYTYDNLDRITGESYRKGNAAATTKMTCSYHYSTLSAPFAFQPVNGVVLKSDCFPAMLPNNKALETIMSVCGPASVSLTRVFHYDNRGRVIQTVEQYGDVTSRISYRYDFLGNLLKKHESYIVANNSEYSVLTQYTYDRRSRLLAETTTVSGGVQGHSVSTSAPTSITYRYNELGQLVARTYGSGANAVTDNLEYNIQGWLTSQSNNEFEMRLRYYDPILPPNIPNYNGNITEWEWRHRSLPDAVPNCYGFTYDKLARLTDSRQYADNGARWVETDKFTERGLSYDKNGNILSLNRKYDGFLNDSLTYSYSGNHLAALYNGPTEYVYEYDANGNMIRDGLNSLKLTYNYLNLISEVRSQDDNLLAQYTYLADGTKIGVRDGSGNNGLDYVGSFVYRIRDGVRTLESVAFGGGRIMVSISGETTNYEPNYFITDHLGSVRVVINGSGTPVEQNDYYPLGLRHSNPDCVLSGNRYKYNGKEQQAVGDLPYLDYGARMFDSRIGRWFNTDPEAEKYYALSPYTLCDNNPLRYADADGADWVDKVMGGVIGVMTNVVPGTTNWRNAYIPNDPSDYNEALETVDNAAVVAGAGMLIGGELGVGSGMTLTLAGGTAALTVVGAPEGAAIAATGGITIAGGKLIAAGGTMIMANAAVNKSNGYNYGEKSNEKINPKKAARKRGKEMRNNQPASEEYAKYRAKELEKAQGKNARRRAHDAKDKIGKDRTKEEINEDYGK